MRAVQPADERSLLVEPVDELVVSLGDRRIEDLQRTFDAQRGIPHEVDHPHPTLVEDARDGPVPEPVPFLRHA